MVKAWRAFSALALLAAVACGDDDGSGPTGSISLTASPTTLTLAQGASGNVTVTLARGGGFSQPVNVTVEGLPTGATATVAPTQLTGTTTSAIVTVNVGSAVPAGTYPITVRASATGVGAATATYSLTVTAAATPNYALTATPSAVSAAAGGSITSTIGIQRTNFTGPVALTLDNPPAGITGSFNPAPATGDQSVLTINVGSTVAPGNHTLTVKGTATGPGDKTTTVALTVTAAANFTISATPAALNLAAGTSGNSTIAIVRTNFTTDVALSLVNPPAGITGVFTPATLTGTTLTSTLALSVASNVLAGTYPVTVRGTAGSVTQDATVTVTVPPAAAGVTLAVNPNTLTIQQGLSGQTTLTATRTNFTGDVTPSVSGAPAGMTVTFNPTTITGANLTSTATVNVGSTVLPGPYTLTITGGGAPANPTTTLQVSVTAPSGGNIVWEFCNGSEVPLKFWRLSGGTWAEVAPTVVGNVTRFSFNVSGTNAGVAYTYSATSSMATSSARQRSTARRFVRESMQRVLDTRARSTSQDVSLTSPYFYTQVFYALSSEIAGLAEVCGTTSPTLVSKNFTVTGMGGSEEGLLGYGGATRTLTSATTSYDVNVPAGTYDYLALFGPAGTIPTFAHNWSHYRIGRGEVVPGASVAINRTGATALVAVPITVTGAPAGSSTFYSQSLDGARGAIADFPIGDLAGGPASMYFLAASDRLATDMNSLLIINGDQSGNDTRASFRFFGSGPPATTSFALPAAVPAFTVSQVAGAPVTTWSVTGTIPSDYQGSTSLIEALLQGAGGGTLYSIVATRGYLTGNGMSTTYTLAGPVLPGFLATWAPPAPLVDAMVIMASGNLTSAPTAGTVINVGTRLVTSP